ncbi:flagellin, partial [bacterium]
MSFRINTNIAAMGALRNVNNSSDGLNRSINRLSTGLRINSAADDPAGLIASESFRTQISSIGQAVSNNQDAINYTKTAEGALDEVNTLLRDARSLAVASANTGVLTAEQLKANQDQLASIASSVTRIAAQTQFGTKKLLDGSSGINAQVTDATKLGSASINGTFGGQSIAANAVITLSSVTAATRAAYSSTGDLTNGTLSAGAFSINGTTFSFAAGTTSAEVANAVN